MGFGCSARTWSNARSLLPSARQGETATVTVNGVLVPWLIAPMCWGVRLVGQELPVSVSAKLLVIPVWLMTWPR